MNTSQKNEKNGTITNGANTFAIVDYFPLGYEIWNIGKHMVDGYLPLCRVIPGTYQVEPDTLKAIKIDGAQTVLAAIGAGHNTIAKMEKFITKNKNAKLGTWEFSQRMKIQAALPIMYQLRQMC